MFSLKTVRLTRLHDLNQNLNVIICLFCLDALLFFALLFLVYVIFISFKTWQILFRGLGLWTFFSLCIFEFLSLSLIGYSRWLNPLFHLFRFVCLLESLCWCFVTSCFIFIVFCHLCFVFIPTSLVSRLVSIVTWRTFTSYLLYCLCRPWCQVSLDVLDFLLFVFSFWILAWFTLWVITIKTCLEFSHCFLHPGFRSIIPQQSTQHATYCRSNSILSGPWVGAQDLCFLLFKIMFYTIFYILVVNIIHGSVLGLPCVLVACVVYHVSRAC